MLRAAGLDVGVVSGVQAICWHELTIIRKSAHAGTTPMSLRADAWVAVFATTRGRVGVAICSDRHFEGVMAALAREGAELVFSPAVTFGAKRRRMGRHEFAVDAARHNPFLGGSNRAGPSRPGTSPTSATAISPYRASGPGNSPYRASGAGNSSDPMAPLTMCPRSPS